MSEHDNMLKYQISDNKEENDLIEDLLGDEPSNQNSKSGKPKDGEMISTDAANQTVMWNSVLDYLHDSLAKLHSR